MKKIFISILSVAMFAACAKTEIEDIVPAAPEQEDEAQAVYVEIGATTGSETKATYDENLKAIWEAGDQILAVQGCATERENETWEGKTYTANAEALDLKSGATTNRAVFGGLVHVYNSTRYFHFAYPASGVSLVTTTHTPGASGLSGNYSTTTTCTYTVPSEQDGIWTPFLCASTDNKTTAENIDGINFGTSHNACFAVRVYEADGITPKKIKSIIITAANNIVGTISATTDNDGSFTGKNFDISGGGNEITADNLQNIGQLGGLYEYRFEVLPVDAGVLTLKVIDENDSEVVRTTSAKTFTANHRSGVKVYWDKAGIQMHATTWFDDSCATGLESALSSATTIYYEASLFGIGAADIKEKGVTVGRKLAANNTDVISDGTKHPNTDSSAKFNSEIAATNGYGVYYIQAYALLNNGEEFKTATQAVYIVSDKILPAITSHTIRSSYNLNGAVEKTNDINGDVINANIQLNDCYASKNLVDNVTFYHNSTPETMIGQEHTQTITSFGAYDCYIEVKFVNGYTIKTPTYKTNVTGIPYNISFKNNANPTDWKLNNQEEKNSYLYLKKVTAYAISPKYYTPASLDVNVVVSVHAYRQSGSYNPSIYVSVSESGVAGGNATKLSSDINIPDAAIGAANFTDISEALNITTNSSNICIFAEGNSSGIFGSHPEAGVHVKSFSLEYKL